MGVVGWRPLRLLGTKMGAEVRMVDRQILLPNGGEVTVRSADDPNTLRGEGLDFAVLDECAYMREEAWTEALRPALSDRQGNAMFISTPKGRNWFWRLFQLGRTADDWSCWQLPTSTNPHIHPSEIEAAKSTLPELVFLQEYLAEFLEGAGAVFRKVTEAATSPRQHKPHEHHGHSIFFGVDWGKQNDFTVVIAVCSTCRQMVMFDRFNQIDYAFQVERLKAHVDRWKPAGVLPERNSMGEPIVETLLRMGLPIMHGHDGKPGFMTLGSTKPELIESLSLAIEKGELAIMDEPVLVSELLAYERTFTPAGNSKYGAPEGMHDDTVMALALAWNASLRGGFSMLIV
jgi:hypothetical protein